MEERYSVGLPLCRSLCLFLQLFSRSFHFFPHKSYIFIPLSFILLQPAYPGSRLFFFFRVRLQVSAHVHVRETHGTIRATDRQHSHTGR